MAPYKVVTCIQSEVLGSGDSQGSGQCEKACFWLNRNVLSRDMIQ